MLSLFVVVSFTSASILFWESVLFIEMQTFRRIPWAVWRRVGQAASIHSREIEIASLRARQKFVIIYCSFRGRVLKFVSR